MLISIHEKNHEFQNWMTLNYDHVNKLLIEAIYVIIYYYL